MRVRRWPRGRVGGRVDGEEGSDRSSEAIVGLSASGTIRGSRC